jgi:endoglucanase
MNEPHDLDIESWAKTSQAAVNAIRGAGATSQIILLPGTDFASAGMFQSGSGAAMLGVKNPDSSTAGLVFNVHQYLDQNYSGTTVECAYNNVETFRNLATWLRSNGRKAMLTETGGGNTQSCMAKLCEQLDEIK